MKNIRKFIVNGIIATVLSLSFGLVLTPTALAQTATPTESAKNEACAGITGQLGGSCTGDGGGLQLQGVIEAVLQILSVIAGIAAVIMIIIAGIKYTTSGGESSAVSSAKRTLLYAIVGLFVVAFAQLIVQFVLTET